MFQNDNYFLLISSPKLQRQDMLDRFTNLNQSNNVLCTPLKGNANKHSEQNKYKFNFKQKNFYPDVVMLVFNAKINRITSLYKKRRYYA